jgi:hypothetical protein
MSTETDLNYDIEIYDEPFEAEDDAYEQYRSVSKAAVLSLVLAVLSLVGLMFPVLLVVAALGLISGLVARRNMRQYPDELTGRVTAAVGIFASLLILVGGSAMHTVIYLTEVPEGYQRITFADLQPTDPPSQPGQPDLPVELDGKRIFVKGYVHPGVSNLGEIKRFILVPDMGTCCFGGQPKLTDMIEVTIVDAPGVKYSQRKRKLGGNFRVANRIKKVAGGLSGGYYELAADYVK